MPLISNPQSKDKRKRHDHLCQKRIVWALPFSSGGSQGGRPGGRETAVVRFLPQQQWLLSSSSTSSLPVQCVKKCQMWENPIHGCVLIYRALHGNIQDIFVKSCYQLNIFFHRQTLSSRYWMEKYRGLLNKRNPTISSDCERSKSKRVIKLSMVWVYLRP